MKTKIFLAVLVLFTIAIVVYVNIDRDKSFKYEWVMPIRVYETHLNGDTTISVNIDHGNMGFSCVSCDYTQFNFIYRTVFDKRLTESEEQAYAYALEIVYEQIYNRQTALHNCIVIDLVPEEYFIIKNKTDEESHSIERDTILQVYE